MVDLLHGSAGNSGLGLSLQVNSGFGMHDSFYSLCLSFVGIFLLFVASRSTGFIMYFPVFSFLSIIHLTHSFLWRPTMVKMYRTRILLHS